MSSSSNQQDSIAVESNGILCHCKNISSHQVSEFIFKNPKACAETVKQKCSVAEGCGKCESDFHYLYQSHHPTTPVRSRTKIALNKFIRSLHLYVSLVAAVFLLFFAISGYAMNHRDDLGLNETEDVELEEPIHVDLLAPSARQSLLKKMSDLGARGTMTEFDRSEDSITITYQSPGRYFEADIDLKKQTAEGAIASLSISDSKFLETLGEIHRSEGHDDHGSSLFIDIMSVLMALVSLSGIVLFLRIATRKNIFSLLCLVASCVSAIWVYYLLK